MSRFKTLAKRWITYVIIGLIAFWAFAISQEAKSETLIEAAPVVAVSGDPQNKVFALLGTERINARWDFSVVLIADDQENLSNRAVQIVRTSSWKRLEVGIGYAFWGNESAAWDTDNTFALHLGYTFGKDSRWGVRLRHWSTGGSSDNNRGLDMLTIGYSFGEK